MTKSTRWSAPVALAGLTIALMMGGPLVAGEHGDGPMGHRGHMQKMMAKIDTDGDGRVSREESASFHANKFDRMDSNSDGFIDAEERKAHHGKMRDKFKKAFEKHQKEAE